LMSSYTARTSCEASAYSIGFLLIASSCEGRRFCSSDHRSHA